MMSKLNGIRLDPLIIVIENLQLVLTVIGLEDGPKVFVLVDIHYLKSFTSAIFPALTG